jgi:hypothetical protein
MPQVHINYPAVVVAAVVAFIVGGLWYSPLLFAKQWIKAHGYTEEEVKQMQKSAGKAYYLHLSICVQGLKLGLLLWAGFAFPLGLMANMFSDKRISVFVIDAGYQLVYLLLMGAILTVWQ